METIALAERYVNTLQVFGEVDELINQAVEQYLIDQLIERIKQARSKVTEYERTYEGQDYATFSRRVQLDAEYYEQVRRLNSLWEQDALEWMYWVEELQTWTQQLDQFVSIVTAKDAA